ncbi:MAG: bifunctional nicotinamide-nucleotide adenylyltransferase/Nudix hydroxylase [Azoarcus sp.]|jgi:bifunctional NMN adenylyltransferase/nudix hydrolase|nr:bifunctional nicotinamide-nucleotide adenylyltransferase/Nudix hydroxylase [Azoarcus sp.]
MSPTYAAAVLIGRFQPFHDGHAALLHAALAQAERAVVVLGSAFRARNARNPFTWQERAEMIAASLTPEEARRVLFVPIRDYYDDARWSKAVDLGVRAALAQAGVDAARPALIGYRKDESTYYLALFPQWSFIASEKQGDIDATAVRRLYFSGDATAWATLKTLVPEAIATFLERWKTLPAYAAMREEHAAIDAYKKEWGSGPFVTLDAVVTAAAHVLLVRRGRTPGKGTWAVPGGFLEGRERLLQGAIRELKEETGIAVPDADLIAALREVAVFDHPDRSQRGRIITHAHWFDLPPQTLPAVAGDDDAAEAKWFPIAALAGMEEEMFEDHFAILNRFLGMGWS